MTDFDSNPFADPEATDPFSDRSVQQASSRQTQPGLDNYNPFAQKPTPTTSPAPVVSPPSQPAVISTQPSAPPPPYSAASAPRIDTSELQRRQEELERKAAELQEKENRLRAQTVSGIKENNWPPIPACCAGRIKPCFYQDFTLEIAPEFIATVRFAYYVWIVHAIAYALNLVFSIGYVCTAKTPNSRDAAITVGLAILYFILFLPASFLCLYRPVYKAFRSDSSINFFAFFLVCGIQILVDVICVLGVPASGFLGILSAIPMLNDTDHTDARNMGGIMFICVIVYAGLTLVDVVLFLRVHRLYRGTGASFSRAQSEFTSGVLKNETVRDAGSQFAASAATTAMNNAANNAARY